MLTSDQQAHTGPSLVIVVASPSFEAEWYIADWVPIVPMVPSVAPLEKNETMPSETVSFALGLSHKYPQITRDDPEKGGDRIGTIGFLSWFIIRCDIPSKSYWISEPDRRAKIEEAWRSKQGLGRLT